MNVCIVFEKAAPAAAFSFRSLLMLVRETPVVSAVIFRRP